MKNRTTLENLIEEFWPKQPVLALTKEEKELYFNRIKKLLTQKNAVLIAHYYTDALIQQLAEETGGIVADSLDMAKFGAKHPAKTLIIAGVKFMGETAKILSPAKKVLMPTLAATCSLDVGCNAEEFKKFIAENPERTVVVYANTSAAVKACADWVVTSSIAVKVIDHLAAQGQKIIWAPDRYLGNYIKQQTDADMLIWQAYCIVHQEFSANALKELKTQNPAAAVLVHPESTPEVIALADAVGSTSQLLKASIELPNSTFIVATETGIFYKMRQASPNKTFIAAPTAGLRGYCRACAHCPWMKMNNLKNLAEILEKEDNEIVLDREIIEKAKTPLERMINFKV